MNKQCTRWQWKYPVCEDDYMGFFVVLFLFLQNAPLTSFNIIYKPSDNMTRGTEWVLSFISKEYDACVFVFESQNSFNLNVCLLPIQIPVLKKFGKWSFHRHVSYCGGWLYVFPLFSLVGLGICYKSRLSNRNQLMGVNGVLRDPEFSSWNLFREAA